jgi:predicted Mrr-cat superfamily restriction endonuclease
MNTWLIRPVPHGTNRITEFRTLDLIAIGWPGIGDLTGQSRENLKTLLAGPPYNQSGLALGNAYATIDIFVNQMNVGDIVLVANGEDIYFAEITSDYQFDISVEQYGYSHQRQVRWLSDTSRKTLSKELRSSLKVHRTAANLSHHIAEIKALASGSPVSVRDTQSTATIDVSYPLRSNFNVDFKIPTDISKTEADRLSTYFRSLYFTE